MTAQTLLASAALLIEHGWSQGADARDSAGVPTEPWNDDARSWSLLGALVAVLERASATVGEALALQVLTRACVFLATTVDATSLAEWNDDPARTKTDISTAIAHAIHAADAA